MKELIEHYLPLIKKLENITGKQILKHLKNENHNINLISKLSEIKFGGILLNEFKDFLKYEPKINKKTPDWLVEIKNEKIIFEVLKINLPNYKMEKKISDFENKIGLPPSGTLVSNGIFNDYGKIIAKEVIYRELIEKYSYKLIICIDASEFDKYIDNKDIELFFDFKNLKSEIYKHPKFIDNVLGLISLSYWVNDFKFIKNKNVKNRIAKPILKKIKKASRKGLNLK